jgi:hypothetical protein
LTRFVELFSKTQRKDLNFGGKTFRRGKTFGVESDVNAPKRRSTTVALRGDVIKAQGAGNKTQGAGNKTQGAGTKAPEYYRSTSG